LYAFTYETLCEDGTFRKKDFKAMINKSQHLEDERTTIREAVMQAFSGPPSKMAFTSDMFYVVPADSLLSANSI